MKVIRYVLILSVIVLYGLQINRAFSKEMHKTIPAAIEDHAWCASIAISKLKHSARQGYVYYPEVFDCLNAHGMTKYDKYLDELGMKFPDNLFKTDLLNEGLKKAKNLKVDKTKQSLKEKQIIPMAATDVGLADYYAWSYRIFGYNLSATLKFYFLLLALGLAIYFLAFYKSIALLVLPVFSTLISYFHLNHLGCCDPIHNFRTLPVLMIVPLSHILLSILKLPLKEMSRREQVLFILQAILLSFVISVRSSAIWSIIALFLVCLCVNIGKLIAFNKQQLKTYFKQHFPTYTLMAIPVAIKLFFSAYKRIMVFSSFGFGLIKRFHSSWFSFVFSCLVLMAFFVLMHRLFFLYKRTRNTVLNKTLEIYFFASTIVLPILLFVLTERPERFHLPFYFIRTLDIFIFLNCLWVGYIFFQAIKDWGYGRFKMNLFSMDAFNGSASMLILFILLAHKAVIGVQTHPVYELNDVMPHHLVYHNAFIGLNINPFFKEKFFSERGDDDTSWHAGFHKFHEKYSPKRRAEWIDYFSPYTGCFLLKVHDKMIREVYLDIIAKYPVEVFKAHLLKVKFLLSNGKHFIILYKKIFFPAVAIFLFFSVMMAFWEVNLLKDLFHLALTLVIMSISSLIPNVYAMVRPELEDSHLILFMTSLSLLLLVSYWLVWRLVHLVAAQPKLQREL